MSALAQRDLTAVLVVATDAHEGPVYAADEDALYFTSVPAPRPGRPPLVAIRRLALEGERFPVGPRRVSTVVADANAANGMALAPDGRLLVCEQAPAAVALLDRATGEREVAVDGWAGAPLNSPNDVAVAPDGSIWFTDPGYGHLQGFRPPPAIGDHVYRHDPRTGETTVAAAGLDKPNGLAFSPDGRVLYVGDSGANHEPGTYDPRRAHQLVAFDVRADGRLGPARLFAVVVPGFPDGIAVDERGRVYAAAASGVHVFEADGAPAGLIPLPGAVNLTFGGPGRNVLFVTADSAIWAVVLDTKGAHP